MNAVHSGRIFQHGQHGRSIGILLSLQRHRRRLSGEGIILLYKNALFSNGLKKLPSQKRLDPFISVIFQGKDRSLISQRLCLSAPVICRYIAEQRVIDRHRGQRHFRPEFFRIQQMLSGEPVCHILRNTVPVHCPQGIVHFHRHYGMISVPVKAHSQFFTPEIFPDLFLYTVRRLFPTVFPFFFSEDGRYFL